MSSDRTIVTDYLDARSRRRLEVVETSYMPDETQLRITGPHGGVYAVVTLDRRAAAKLGAELVRLYGERGTGDVPG